MANPFLSQYPNKPAGVKQFLIEGVGIETDTIICIVPIPNSPGTWGVVLEGSGSDEPSIIIQLKGHSTVRMNSYEFDQYATNALL